MNLATAVQTDHEFNLLLYSRLSRAGICKRLRRPGIDSEDSIPPAYVAWRASTTNRVVVPARRAGNRFLCSLKGLQIRALAGRYDNPIPTRFLALIDCSKIPALYSQK
jgi:hypothetical protein